jgi:hypothetical protein
MADETAVQLHCSSAVVSFVYCLRKTDVPVHHQDMQEGIYTFIARVEGADASTRYLEPN